MRKTLIRTNAAPGRPGTMIPLQSLVSVQRGEDIKTIVAGKNKEYIPMNYYGVKNPETLNTETKKFRELVSEISTMMEKK